eukprot:CAMPEP_0116838698 /NCGR_PEP_ID=MMETSP0418-20121206/9357_1 /TAXON_ID=1158023 /ORGANISM="Astrosyne radiata, Strain 13vi08-1A" /LENGTH=173 /DNA_ID=CAMNT_0004468729 /DNA_START=17 /DNA_END=538 /DNA_ORIENTATION=+
MNLSSVLLPIIAIGTFAAPSFSCPGSPAYFHCKCEMTITFDQDCGTVEEEILSRLTSETWVDPHNHGTYTLLDGSDHSIIAKRLSGNRKYTDLMDFFFLTRKDGGCTAQACSESQVFSIFDWHTNYCNLRDLYCNSQSDQCPVLKHELTYTETYQNCWQHHNFNACSTVSKQE